MTYRTRYFTTLQPLAVLDVLMADESNPRALDFQVKHLADLYQNLPRHLAEDLQAMRDALALLRSFDLRELKYPPPGSAMAAVVGLMGCHGLSASCEIWNSCCHRGRITCPTGTSATRAPCRSRWANDL